MTDFSINKKEIFHLHTLLARIKYYLEEERPDADLPSGAFEDYESLDVSATNVDDNKAGPTDAVFTLARELADLNPDADEIREEIEAERERIRNGNSSRTESSTTTLSDAADDSESNSETYSDSDDSVETMDDLDSVAFSDFLEDNTDVVSGVNAAPDGGATVKPAADAELDDDGVDDGDSGGDADEDDDGRSQMTLSGEWSGS